MLRELWQAIRGIDPRDAYADIGNVIGQKEGKTCCLLSCAGKHNLLLIGPPGEGKSMLAESMRGIMPRGAPYVSVGPTTTITSLIGGGRSAPYGGLLPSANEGILYLDELLQFEKPLLEILRQPIEDKSVSISRNGATRIYACDAIIVGSANPCNCGYSLFSPTLCTCSQSSIAKYRAKLSGPMRDRVDLFARLENLGASRFTLGTDSKQRLRFRKLVAYARAKQEKRGVYNSDISSRLILSNGIGMESDAWRAYKSLGDTKSTRAIVRLGRVARTLADLSGQETIDRDMIDLVSYATSCPI